MYFDRFDICEAYAMFDMLWGPTPYGQRLYRMRFKASVFASLEGMTENSKAIYGALVRKHHRLLTGYERYAKRNRNAPSWPGTRNMPRGDVRAWLASIGALDAVEAMVQP